VQFVDLFSWQLIQFGRVNRNVIRQSLLFALTLRLMRRAHSCEQAQVYQLLTVSDRTLPFPLILGAQLHQGARVLRYLTIDKKREFRFFADRRGVSIHNNRQLSTRFLGEREGVTTQVGWDVAERIPLAVVINIIG